MADQAGVGTRRRWLKLSLRGTMLLVVGLGLWLGWQARRVRRQREAVVAVKAYGGFVRYDWEYVDGKPLDGAAPRGPKWLRSAIGDDYFQEVVVVDMVHATDRRGMPILSTRETDELMAKLAAFPRLRQLWTADGLVTDRAMETIGSLTELEELMMWDAKVTEAGFAKVRGLRKLRALDLGASGLGDDAVRHLTPLARLEYLHLTGNPVTSRGMASLSVLKALKFLGIGHTRVSDEGLEHLRGLTNLEEIWVTGSDISNSAVMRFQEEMPNLRVVR